MSGSKHRTRTRGDATSVSYSFVETYYNCSGEKLGDCSATRSVANVGTIETITDDISAHRMFKPCVHTVYKSRPIPWDGFYAHKSATQNKSHDSGAIFNQVSYVPPACVLPNYQEWQEFEYDALQALVPSLTSNVDLLRSIVELKDTFSLARSAIKLKRMLKHVKRRSGRQKLWEKLKAKPLRDLSGHALAYQFGIKPIIADFVKLYMAVEKYPQAVSDFYNRRLKPQKRSFTRTLGGVANDGTYKNSAEDAYFVYTTYGQRQTKLSATLKYVYNAPDMPKGYIGEAKMLASYFGLIPKFSTAWQLLPFSFVADWAFDFTKAIQSFEKPYIGTTELQILDFCMSYKAVDSVKRQIHCPWVCADSEPTTIYIGQTSKYRRYVRAPNLTIHPTVFGDFNEHRMVLSSELLMARSRGSNARFRSAASSSRLGIGNSLIK